MQIFEDVELNLRKAQAQTRKKVLFADFILLFAFIQLFHAWRSLWREHNQAILSGSFNTIDSQTLFTLIVLPFILLFSLFTTFHISLGLPRIRLGLDGIKLQTLFKNKFYPWSSIDGFFVPWRGSRGGGQLGMKINRSVDNDRKVIEKGYKVLMSLSTNLDGIVADLNKCRDTALRLREGASNSSVANITNETNLRNGQSFGRLWWVIIIPAAPSLFSFIRELSSPAPDYEKAFLSLIPVFVVIVTFWLISLLVRRAGKAQGNSEN